MTLLNQLFDNHPCCQETTGQEHQDASEAEEVHRLFAECTEEPKRYKVKETVYKTFKAEFADSIFAFLVLDWFLCDASESCILCKVWNMWLYTQSNPTVAPLGCKLF